MPTISSKAIYWSKTLSKFVSVQIVIQVLGFASGILLVRTLVQQQYAYYIIANTMQATITLLADSGIDSALSAIGGKVWQDRYRFSQLINTALQLRGYLAVVATTIITPLLLWMLISNGASPIYAILIAIAVLIGVSFQLTSGILIVVLRLQSHINRLQNLDLVGSFSRLCFLGIAYLIFLNASTAVFAVSISLGLQLFLLNYWIPKTIDTKAPINKEDRQEILKSIKRLLPNTIYYCLQGQLSILLIGTFGNTQSIAEVGALGRLAAIFTIIGSILSNIVLPSFARCQSVSLLQRRYFQVIGAYCLFASILLGITVAFPNQILWILGKNYRHLHEEVILMVTSSILYALLGTMWAINASKAWVSLAWIFIPTEITIQALLLLALDISTVKGVILFGIFPTLPGFVMNGYMTYRGLQSMKILPEN